VADISYPDRDSGGNSHIQTRVHRYGQASDFCLAGVEGVIGKAEGLAFLRCSRFRLGFHREADLFMGQRSSSSLALLYLGQCDGQTAIELHASMAETKGVVMSKIGLMDTEPSKACRVRQLQRARRALLLCAGSSGHSL